LFASETLSTLRFANRAAKITNNVEASSFKSIDDLKLILKELKDDQHRVEGTSILSRFLPSGTK